MTLDLKIKWKSLNKLAAVIYQKKNVFRWFRYCVDLKPLFIHYQNFHGKKLPPSYVLKIDDYN